MASRPRTSGMPGTDITASSAKQAANSAKRPSSQVWQYVAMVRRIAAWALSWASR